MALAERLTWRQIERYYGWTQRRRNRRRADLMEAVAAGFGGEKVTDTIRKLRGG